MRCFTPMTGNKNSYIHRSISPKTLNDLGRDGFQRPKKSTHSKSMLGKNNDPLPLPVNVDSPSDNRFGHLCIKFDKMDHSLSAAGAWEIGCGRGCGRNLGVTDYAQLGWGRRFVRKKKVGRGSQIFCQ